MKREYEIKEILDKIASDGISFPGLIGNDNRETRDKGGSYTIQQTKIRKEKTDKGSVLRKLVGNYWQYMPVTLIYFDKDDNGEKKETEYELQNAIIKIENEKTIVETAMVGRQGKVKELININDYNITITGAASAEDFPEADIQALRKLYQINESIGLKSALTDLFMEEDDKVVIKSIEFKEMQFTENVQSYTIKLVTDKSFELTIE